MGAMTATSAASWSQPADARSGQYLTYSPGGEEFAIEAPGVRQVMGVRDIDAARAAGWSGQLEIGVMVDAVSEVVTMQAADIENTPDFGGDVALPHGLGMARIQGRVPEAAAVSSW
jgi:chemotaxis signal transduction protein